MFGKNKILYELGTCEFSSGTLVGFDPFCGYDKNPPIFTENILPGTYRFSVMYDNFCGVVSAKLLHEQHARHWLTRDLALRKEEHYTDTIPVDGGAVSYVTEEMYRKLFTLRTNEPERFGDEGDLFEVFENAIDYGRPFAGFAQIDGEKFPTTRSGVGDGCYRSYYLKYNGQIVGIETIFVEDQDDDEIEEEIWEEEEENEE